MYLIKIRRCLQNAKVCVLENEICLCKTSGIYMRLAAHGLIAGNDIYCTSEAAIDVRRQADPLIQVTHKPILLFHLGNFILDHVEIVKIGWARFLSLLFQTAKTNVLACHVFMMVSLFQCNRIHHSKRSGIVVLGSGAGLIRGNDIYQNREAAIHVLYRGNPYITGNRSLFGSSLKKKIRLDQKCFFV